MSDTGKPKEIGDVGRSPFEHGESSSNGHSDGPLGSEMLEQLISLFAETVPQSIWITDAEGNVKFLNKQWYEYAGTSGLPATASQIAAESLHPEDGPVVLAAFEKARQTGEGFEVEQRNRAANGEYRWFLNRANPYRDPSTGKIVLWVGVGIDIHDRKVAEAALRESEHRLKLVQAAAGQGYFDYDIRKDEALCSPEFLELLGLDPDERVVRSVLLERVHENDREVVTRLLTSSIEERTPFNLEHRIVRRGDGEIRWISTRSSLLLDDRGEPWRLVGSSGDITEQMRAREDEKFLFEISELIRTTVDPAGLLAQITEKLGRHLELHRCLFNEIDLDNDIEIVHSDYARDGESVAGRHKISIYSPESSASMADGRTIVNGDAERDPRTAKYFEATYQPAREIAYITVPMMRDGRWVASLWCSDDRPRDWRPHEIALVENIAERAWAAVERLRTEAGLREQRNRQRALAETALRLAETDSPESQLKVISEEALTMMGADQAVLAVAHVARSSQVHLSVSRSNAAVELRIPKVESAPPDLADQIRELHKPVRGTLAKLRNHKGLGVLMNLGAVQAEGEGIAVPLGAPGTHTFGIMLLSRKAGSDFTPEDESVLMQLSQLAFGVIERTNARAVAERNQRTFFELVENAPFGMYVVDSDLRISTMNPGSRAGAFANVETVIGRGLAEALRIMWPEGVAAEMVESFKKTLETGQPYKARNFTHLRGDTATVESYEWELHRIVLPDGSFGVVCYYYDSTQLRETERREREQVRRALNATAKFEAVFNQSGFHAGILDVNGTLLEINDAAVVEGGYPRPDVIERPYWDIGWWADLEVKGRVRSAVESAARGETFRSMLPFRRADGAQRFVEFAIHPVRNAAGEIIYLHPTATDITERKSAEEKLRYQLQLTQGIAESAAVSIFVSDRQGNVTYANPEAVKAFGYSPAELRGRNLHEAIHFKYPDGTPFPQKECPLSSVFSDGRPVFGFEGTFFKKDGTSLELICSNTPILENGVITGEVMVMLDITERRRTENRLRESEERFRHMADDAPVMVWVTEPDGHCTFLSRSWYEFTGQREAEALGFGWLDAVHPEDRERSSAAFHDANASGAPFRAEYRLRRSDGQYRWAIDSARPRFSENGVFMGYVGSVMDITERKSAEEELRRSEEEFRNLANAAPALVWVADRNGDLRFFNDRWYEYTGMTPEESVGNGWGSAVLHEDLAEVLPKWQASQISGEPCEGACRYRRHDGEYRWHTFRALPRRDESGQIIGWYGVSVDVHEERVTAGRVKISEERYRALTELSPQMVYMCRPDGAITYVNKYTLEWTGKELEDFLSGGWVSLIHPDHRERIRNVWSTAAELQTEYEVDIPFRYADGSYRTLYNRALPIRDESGVVQYWIGTALDVEDRKQAEEDLRESEERFRHASDSAPVLIWMSDESDRYIWFNKPWLDFTGRRLEQEVGAGWADGLHPDDVERCRNIFYRSFGMKREFVMEFRLRRSDGQYRWMLNRAVPRSTPDGRFLGYIGSCLDIHDRRAAESALRQSEARLQLATRIGNYGTWDINYVDGRQIWSDKLFEIFGIPPTPDRAIASETYAALIFPEDLERLNEINEKAHRERSHFAAEYRIKRGDTGEVRWLDAAAHNFYDAEGKPVRVVGITQDITERKLANEAIRASEERLTLAQQAGNVGVWDWDAVENRTFWSDQMWAFYGEEPQTAPPNDPFWFPRLHPDDRERLPEAVRKALVSGTTEFKDEFRIIRADGELRWLEVIATIERDGDGEPARMYGVNLDITERKAIAERIRNSEVQLRLITDSIPALVSYVDSGERFRFANRRHAEWIGIEPENVIGLTMAEVFGPEAGRIHADRVGAVLKGETVNFESWIEYPLSGRKFVRASYVPDVDEKGDVLGFYSLVTDITAQRLSEEMLRSTEDRMKTISESFTDYAIMSMNAEGMIDSWNPGAENIFGWSSEEIIGRHVGVVFTPEDNERGVPATELQQASRAGRSSDERWHVRKDGTRFYASGVTAPLYDDGELSGFARISADLTEKKRNAEALQRAYDEMENRVLERTRELASMNEALMREISERQTAERQKIELLKRLVTGQEQERRRIARDLHDHLGQRLTALRLKLASLREACAGQEELYARATRLQQIAELIDSEVSFLAWELRPSTLDEIGLIDAISAFVKEWSRHYEIEAEFHSAGLGDARLDREAETHLYRITQEALNNTYKHANARNVSVLIERTGDSIVLIIEDDGEGMELEEGTPKKKTGRGLGLGGMRERAELIGGSLEIESQVGNGTTIYVRIPVNTDERKK